MTAEKITGMRAWGGPSSYVQERKVKRLCLKMMFVVVSNSVCSLESLNWIKS